MPDANAAIRADYDAVPGIGESAAGPIHHLDIADHPTAAVEVHQQCQLLARRRMIDAHRQLAGGAGHQDVADFRNILRLTLQIAEAHPDDAGEGGAHLLERRQPLFAHFL